MKIQVLLLSFLISLPIFSKAQDNPTVEAESLFTRMMSQINSRHVRWVQATAKETNEKKLESIAVMKLAENYGALYNLNSMDIEALAFLVLVQASKSAQEDLKAIMSKVKSINERKAQLRAASVTLKDRNNRISRSQMDSIKRIANTGKSSRTVNKVSGVDKLTVSKQEINDVAIKIENDLDSISEMGEMESLKLQMAMDRKSKMLSTLSNIMKKIHQTSDGIIQNLK